jgi:F-type H+-transporting ATPase subunit b
MAQTQMPVSAPEQVSVHDIPEATTGHDIPEVAAGHAGTPGTVADAEHAAGHEAILGIFDSYAIVGFAFLAFVLLLWKFGAFRMLGGALDGAADKVRADLAEAAQLKAEAEAMKAKAAADAAEAAAQAKETLANAEVEAKRIVEQAAVDAETAIVRRTKLAEDRIAAEARAAEADLRARAADIAVKAAETLLAARSKELTGLTDAAIAGLDKR